MCGMFVNCVCNLSKVLYVGKIGVVWNDVCGEGVGGC